MSRSPTKSSDADKKPALKIEISDKLAKRRKGFRIPYNQDKENNTDTDSIISGLREKAGAASPVAVNGSGNSISKGNAVRVTFTAAGTRNKTMDKLKESHGKENNKDGIASLSSLPSSSPMLSKTHSSGFRQPPTSSLSPSSSVKLTSRAITTDNNSINVEDRAYAEYLDSVHILTSEVPMYVDSNPDFEIETKLDHDFLFHADELMHMVLELPRGFHPRPSEDETHHKTPLQINLLGLPGGLNLTPAVTNKYFGVSARRDFFDRFHWLSHQANLMGSLSSTTTTNQQQQQQRYSKSNDDEGDDESCSQFNDEDTTSVVTHDCGTNNGYPVFPHHVNIEPGQELMMDYCEQPEEYIPFAPRRPNYQTDNNNNNYNNNNNEDEDDIERYQNQSLSTLRHHSRDTFLASKPAHIPTLEEILGSDSAVVARIAQDKAIVQAELDKKTREQEADKRDAK